MKLQAPTLPKKPADPVFSTLVSEIERLQEAFDQTSLAPFVSANNAALLAWHHSDTLETRHAVREADLAMENAAIADPDAVRIYARLCGLRLQLDAHCRAVGIHGRN